jgi:hypothetical protein
LLWQSCPPAIKDRISIFGRTRRIAEMFATDIGMPSYVCPYPCPDDLVASREPSPPDEPDAPMVVSFVGGTRKERGAELIADVVRQCSGLGIRFFIHVGHGGDTNTDTKMLTALSAQPLVRVHDGPLERRDFYAAIANSVVLLPYRPQEYRWRDSGVYCEATLLDAPALVTAGTWMADEVKAHGNGLVIEGFSVNAVVACIMRAQRELPALRAAAASFGRGVREKNGVARCLDAIAEACQRAGAG